MQTRRREIFTTIKTEGAILPSDILKRIAETDRELAGLKPKDYHLSPSEHLNEAINRSWNRLTGVWRSFRTARQNLPEDDPGTTLTRERWMLILFQELGYGRLQTSKAIEIEGKSYPISHIWMQTPVHLVGCRIDLDRRTAGVAGAARTSPHSLVQEFLNRSDDHLWAFVSNGQKLRILRDNVSLTRQAYVEFDLESMMENEIYSDFVLLWLLCHQSRVEAERPDECYLEQWSKTAQEQGTRVREQLRDGVQTAIEKLGSGFLSHRANRELRARLKSGELDKQHYYHQILRTVYRLLFLFAAEDRGLLLIPDAPREGKERYTLYYSTARLRRLARRRRRSKHPDLWRGLSLVFRKLSSDKGCPDLALPALGSFLWSDEATPDIDSCDIENRHFLEALQALSYITDKNVRRQVDYKNLGPEELGSVYESLLELHPELNADAGAFRLSTAGGHERKTTGSYYTPTSLITCLLDSALDPVLDEAAAKDDPEAAILNLKICDPACGSGHFLIAAAHRMAKRLAAVRTGDEEPSPRALGTALRDIVGHCIYGVDINPMAVELCKVNLWMEALDPGRPLSFLDHHIKYGNSLLGTTPALLKDGIPDDAFKPIEGDDRAFCTKYKKQNRDERKNKQISLFDDTLEAWEDVSDLSAEMTDLDGLDDDDIQGVKTKQKRFDLLQKSIQYKHSRLISDAWCSAFVWLKQKTERLPYPITEEVFRTIERNPDTITEWMQEAINRLSSQYKFFHWHLEFPDVFQAGGFDVVLGNPPWERIKMQEKEWFAERDSDIANASNAAARRRKIEQLKTDNPPLYEAFKEDKRQAEGESCLVRNSGHYPLCGRGDVNTYSIFAELNRSLINSHGRVGCIVPSGIATDDTTKYFFQDLMDTRSLVSLYDFENRRGIFTGVHRSYKFCLLTLTSQDRPTDKGADFLFFAHEVSDLNDKNRKFSLSAQEIKLLNPKTRTCPIFRSHIDASLTKEIYQNSIVISDVEPPIRFQPKIDMTDEVGKFLKLQDVVIDKRIPTKVEKNGKGFIRLFESKLMWHYDHRFATFQDVSAENILAGNARRVTNAESQRSTFFSCPRYYVPEKLVRERYESDELGQKYLLTVRRLTNATNERTAVFTVTPFVGCGNSMFVFRLPSIESLIWLFSCGCSFAFDYISRNKMGGTNFLQFIIEQLPVADISLTPIQFSLEKSLFLWLKERVLELTYTSWDLKAFGEDCNYFGPPFIWDEKRRFIIRCELDAAFFHLYLGSLNNSHDQKGFNLAHLFPTPHDAVDYILETFLIVKRKDEAQYGEYRTKRTILEIYDAMQQAIETGGPYQTILDTPPADPSVAHPRESKVKDSER